MKLKMLKEENNNWQYLNINGRNVTFHDLHEDGIHYNLQTGFGSDVKSKDQKFQDIDDDLEIIHYLFILEIPFEIKQNGQQGPRLVIERKYFINHD